jgi:GNAT superfamily N-acetyltransferase
VSLTTRPATVADVPALVAMGQQFLAASSYHAHLASNPDQMATFATSLIDSPNGAVFVLDHDGRPVGVIGLVVFAHPLSGERMASECFWWAGDEARGHGLSLLHAAEAWAREQGAERLQMVAPEPRVGRLYRRFGYQWIEESYQRSLQ